MRKLRGPIFWILLASLLPCAARAATYTVNTTTDAVDAAPGDGSCASAAAQCTLRAAIQESNASSGGDVINVPPGLYVLTVSGSGEDGAAQGDLDITDTTGFLTISGSGTGVTVIDADFLDRVFDVIGTADVDFWDMTIRGGRAPGNEPGGGIRHGSGFLNLRRIVLENNDARDGGALFTDAGSTVAMERCAVVQNTASSTGGGVRLGNGGDITSSTFSGNSSNQGGGIWCGGLACTVGHVTSTANDAVSGGGIFSDTVTASLSNSIIALNSSGGDCAGSMSSQGSNIDSDSSCNLGGAGDQPSTDPLLGTLQDNGGGTLTHALQGGSPAIDAAEWASCISPDQRGVGRPIDGDGDTWSDCDIGAYEFDPAAATGADLSLTKVVDNATPNVGNNVVFTLTVSNAGPSDATGVTVEDLLPAGYTWVSDDSGGTYNTGTGVWTVGNLAAAGSATLNITVSVNASGPYDNAAQVLTANESDPNSTPGNGTTNGENDEATVAVVPVVTVNISGSIFEDINGDSGLGDAVSCDGVRVRLYADNDGNRVVNAGDLFLDETTTVGGDYTFAATTSVPGLLVTVDSRTIPSSLGGNQGEMWAEQTYGDDPDTPALDLGSMSGGRNPSIPDDVDPASTAPADNIYEHVAVVDVSGGDVSGVDFAFTFNVIVHQLDGPDADPVEARTRQGSLRQFVQNANSIPGVNSTTLNPGTYLLTLSGAGEDNCESGDLDVKDPLVINGADTKATIIDGNSSDRVFHIGSEDLTLNDLTVRNGDASGDGGGILVGSGALSLSRATVVNSSAGARGGGIYSQSASLSISGVTISGNSSVDDGGGIYAGSGSINADNSTISGNTSNNRGGGIYKQSTSLNLTNVTIFANLAAVDGRGVFRNSGSETVLNTIIAHSTMTGSNCNTALGSSGFNIDSSNSCGFTAPGDQFDTDPLLGPLQDNGGPTLTHALPAGSPAVDRGEGSGCPPTDQRGVLRPFDGDGDTSAECDVGAYEFTGTPLAVDLSLSKTVDNATPDVGSNVVFTLTVSNAGPSDATGVTVEDLLPAGYTWVSDDSGGAFNTGTGVWTVGNLAAAGSATLNLTVSVNAAGPYDNAAQVLTANESDLDSTPGNGTTNGEDDEATAGTTPGAVVDLALAKSVDNATPDVGNNVVFTLTVSNGGPSDATGVSIEDLLSAGYSWVSDDSAGAYNTGTGVWTVGNLAAAGSATLNLTVSVNAAGPHDNAAQVLTANENDLDSTPGNGTTNGEDDEATASTTPGAVVDLALAKSVDNATPDVGSNVVFTLTVSNAGPSDATGVSIEDLLPAGYTWVSDDSAGAYNTGTGVWTVGNLAAAGSATLNLTVSVNAAGPHDNAAQVLTANESDLDSTPGNGTTNGEDDEATAGTTPGAVVDLALAKSVDNATPDVGSNVVFTLTVSNAGPSDATGVSIEDLLPAGYTWVSDDSAGAYNTGTGVWTVGNLAAAGSSTLNITVSVNAAGPYDNAAQVLTANESDLDSTPGNGTTNGEDDEATAGTTPGAVVDLALAKSVDNATPDVGSNVVFTLTVSNAGPSDATGVSIEDLLPAGYTWVSDDSAGAYNTGTGVWTVGNLAAAGSSTLNITVSVNAAGPYDNAAQVLTANESDLDSTPGNGTTNGEDDEATAGTTPGAVVDLSLAKSVDNATPNVGNNVVFTLTVSNAGPSDATGVTVEDLLPAGYSWVSDDSGGAYNTGTGVWTVGNLAAAGSSTLNITVSVNAAGPYDNAAQVLTANESDLDSTPGNGTTNGEDDEATAGTTPGAVVDLSLAKSVDNATPNVGNNVVFTLTVSNAGPSDATGVSIEDLLPAGYTWVSDDSAGAYNTGTGVWTVGNLAAAGSSTLNITVSVNAAGPYDNAAQVLTANESDLDSTPGNGTTNGEDDEATAGTTPGAVVDLSLAKSVDNATPNVGNNVVFTLTVSNAGPSDATGVTVEDLLPAGYSWVSDDSGGAYNTGTGVWTVGNLAAAGSSTLNITVSVNAAGPYDNAAQVLTANESDLDSTPGNGTTNGEDDEATAGTTPGAVVDLSLAKSVDNATPNVGNNVVFTLTVSNAGPSDATGVTVEDLLPAGYSWVSDDSGGAYNTGTGVWTVGNLAAAGSSTLNITVSVNAAGPYDNAAQVLTANESDLDSTPGNGTTNGEDDEASATTTPVNMADLSLSKGVNNATPDVGANVTFTLTVSNAGPLDTTNVVVADRMPAGCSFVSASGDGVFNGGSGAWTVGSVPAGASRTVNITATVNPTGPYISTAEVMASDRADPDSTPGNGVTTEDDYAVRAITPNGTPQNLVLLTKTATQRQIVMGESVGYVLTVQNTTTTALPAVVLEDFLPPGFKLVTDSVILVQAGADGLLGTPDDTRTSVTATNGRPVMLGSIDLAASETVKVLYLVRPGSGARLGENKNTARPMQGGAPIGNQASAVVDITGDPILDQATIIGKVYRDRNENGIQDAGEGGVPQAMVVLDDGTYALTDPHGRYHLPNVDPGQRMVKVNIHSLPVGAFATDENSRILWITPGLMMKANFPVHWEDHTEKIGRPEVHGLQVQKKLEESPVEVVGNADAPAILVSGKLVELSTADVFLATEGLDEVIWLKGNQLQGPARFFPMDSGDAAPARSWSLTIRDSREAAVRVFQGEGKLPEFIEWDGRNETGALVEPGQIYQYQLAVVGEAGGETATSPWRLFGVNRETVLSLQLSGGAFEFNRHELSDEAKSVLREVVQQLADFPDEKIVIEGHTDSVGSREYNIGLSKRRAEAARSFLVDKLRFPASRVTLRWHGKERPIAPNQLEEGRMLNRRVDIKAELEQVESAEILDVYRTDGIVEVNGHRIEVGEQGRFTGRVPLDGEDRLDIEVIGQQGVSARTTIELPAIEIVQPPLNSALFRYGESAHGCEAGLPAGSSADDRVRVTVTCRLVGRTQPGNVIELAGEPLEVRADGTFIADLAATLGKTTYGLLAHNQAGYTRITNLTISVSDRGPDGGLHVVAEAIPNLAVQLPPPGIRLPKAEWELTGTTDPGNRVTANDVVLDVQADGTFTHLLELPHGKSQLRVQVVDPQGRSGEIEREMDVARTQLFLLAFFDGKFGEMEEKGLIQPSGSDSESDFYSEGRAAFYLKGVIAGKYLISSALDTGTNEFDELFDDFDDADTQTLITNLDPDRFYPIYGDSSTVVFDAQSQGKFYLALESDDLDVLVGNFPISLTDTELATYNRTLYGGRLAYQSVSRTRFGEPDTEVMVFGADVRQIHVRDELRSTGASLYYLSHKDVVEGSEEVQLVIRDKNTNLQLSRQRMVQNIDYVIKYPEGRIMFRRPLPMVGEDTSLVNQEILGGHPVFIQVDYETRPDFFEKTTTGARARQHVGDRLAVGATYIDDEATSGSYELTGFDTEVRIGRKSRILGEYADSTGTDAVAFVSSDGGVSYSAVPVTGTESGSAWKVAAELDVGEWFGKPDRYQVNAYYKEIEPGFSSSGNLQEQGTEKLGFHSALRVTDKDSVHIRYNSEDRTGTLSPGAVASSDLSSLQWSRIHERWSVSAEIFDEKTEDVNGAELKDTQLGAARLQWQATEKLTTGLLYQYTLDGPDNDQITGDLAYQASRLVGLTLRHTEGDLGRASQAGVLVKMADKDFYLTQRVADDSLGDRQATILGAKAPLGAKSHVYSEYQWHDDSRGDRVTSLLGVQRQWDVAPGLKVLYTGEMSDMETGAERTRRTSGGASVLYSNERGLQAVTRNVLFFDRGPKDLDQFLTFNQVDYRFSTDWSVFGKYRYSKTEDPDLDQVEARLEDRSVGLAYRPVSQDRFNLLGVYTRLVDQRPQSPVDIDTVLRIMDVVSLETNYELIPRIEWISKLAYKEQSETIGGLAAVDSRTQLGVQRLNVNVWKPIFWGVEYRLRRELEGDDQRQGALTEIMWSFQRNFRVGVGYNWTDFSDDLVSQNDYSTYGWFIRAQGRY